MFCQSEFRSKTDKRSSFARTRRRASGRRTSRRRRSLPARRSFTGSSRGRIRARATNRLDILLSKVGWSCTFVQLRLNDCRTRRPRSKSWRIYQTTYNKKLRRVCQFFRPAVEKTGNSFTTKLSVRSVVWSALGVKSFKLPLLPFFLHNNYVVRSRMV